MKGKKNMGVIQFRNCGLQKKWRTFRNMSEGVGKGSPSQDSAHFRVYAALVQVVPLPKFNLDVLQLATYLTELAITLD